MADARTPPTRALVLAGGSGTRLWPRSTDARPKPFLKLTGTLSLLQEAVARAEALAGAGNVYVSGRRAHEGLLLEELPALPPDRRLLEPARRNTGPAIAFAALAIAESVPDAVLAVVPSDQAVRDERAFLEALARAVDAARASDAIVTLGIRPSRPETGFGYMEVAGSGDVREVVRFIEKPATSDAERYAASGIHLWNAGIFVARLDHLLAEIARRAPAVDAAARRALAARRAGDAAGADAAFAAAPSISFDYAVMEKTPRVLAVPCDCGWSDLGSWEAVWEFRQAGGGNVLEGSASSTGGDGNLVLANERPVRVVGLSGIAVVDSPDGLLVMRRGSSELLRADVEATLSGRPASEREHPALGGPA
jgi:mannose-1-phosphate guanylyltransferase/mannose-6-phosphate isomerase